MYFATLVSKEVLFLLLFIGKNSSYINDIKFVSVVHVPNVFPEWSSVFG